MRRRGSGSIAANPVLIGAATTLVVIVAVFLAYNANNGLPFVPTYQLKAELPNAANLVKGNEVRIGGTRVGVVSGISPQNHKNGRVTAVLDLKLQTSIKPLPKDSTILVRPKSALGLKYVEITKGKSKKGYPSGATIPVTQAQPKPVEIDQVFNTFDKRTRIAQRVNLFEFGNGFAGRGQDLNTAIYDLNPLLRNVLPVLRNLADPTTDLGGFFRNLGRTAALVAPVADAQAAMFRNLDTTFTALASVARPYIQQSIALGPKALDTAIASFQIQRPFLENSTQLFAELRPGAEALKQSAPALADALTIGTPVLKRSVGLSNQTADLFRSLDEFASDPLVPMGVRDLTNTASILAPTIAYLTPVQTTCNYVGLWFRNVASLLSEGDSNGTWQRFIIIAAPQGPNNEGGPSSIPANGPTKDNHLHINMYPNAASPGVTHECEAGNETYDAGTTVIGNVPGNQGIKTEKTVQDKRN